MIRNISLVAVAVSFLTTSCATNLDHFNKPPSMSPPGKPRNPVPPIAQRRVAITQSSPAQTEAVSTASLWRSGPESLFGDRRARALGDIVTVTIEIDEEAEIRNRTNRNRSSSDDLSVPALLGVNTLAARALPGGANLNPAVETESNSTSVGDGLIQREERITLRVAATVDGVLPNGHLVISGSQEIRVNYELRELQVAGVVRPEDISRGNIITYDKIADARISYGGRGQISDLQRARYGQQVIDLISPF
ncbi:MAG: flagellar basal body L-ring protein FlgH [Pseudomonadota bacterium]